MCCDGTWQDGLTCRAPSQYTNILKIARALDPEDSRSKIPIPQIVYYQAGVGTTSVYLLNCFDGAVGGSLRDKVEDAYAFIASNYQPSDEIFLFGFSRGAYTARMVAAIIGEIGILDKRDMFHFADIFDAYQERSHAREEHKRRAANDFLVKYTDPKAPGRIRADPDGDKFTIKFIGVFDTVGALGLPTELRVGRKSEKLFGFPNRQLGTHIQYAYQALAIDETRKDFTASEFRQTKEGHAKGQVLKQVWFSGCHSDIGGGYAAHDLSDITLMWMVSHVDAFLSFDLQFLLEELPQPVDDWGKQPPHDSKTGVFTLASCSTRMFPSLSSPESPTFQYIHPSVLERAKLPPSIKHLIENNPNIVCKLQPFELSVQEYWQKHTRQDKAKAMAQDALQSHHLLSFKTLIKVLLHLNTELSHFLTKMRHKID